MFEENLSSKYFKNAHQVSGGIVTHTHLTDTHTHTYMRRRKSRVVEHGGGAPGVGVGGPVPASLLLHEAGGGL